MLSCSNCGHENPDGAKFCMECAASLGASASAGEVRKIISALFCDLVGSTSLGEQHDPEVLRPILDGYFTEMRSAVERHGGRVQKFIGDAVVAVFGLPTAHEDDALRAVRAGIEMQERLQTLNGASPIPLAARIGITTGEVLVPGDGKPIIGDAMNTAARLEAAADPGAVLIGEPTWRLVRESVTAEAVEPVVAKGKAEPVPAWRIVSTRAGTTRDQTPFVGRDRPMRMLEAALEDAVEARASVLITVLAPPGVGKSRLAEAFAHQVEERSTILIGHTPSYGDGVAFAPLVDLLSQAVGRTSGDAGEVATALRHLVAGEPDGPSVGDRLAQFLGVGEASGADTAWAVRRLLEVLASDRPLVVVLEDIHWAEPPMLDLIDAVVERLHGPAVFLCLARPELLELRPDWAAGKAHAVTTTLPPLSPADTRHVATILLGGDPPRSVVDRVCERAEGNPLFLEQLTAMLEDQGLLVEGVWTGPSDAEVEVPGTLHALLAARLDRLDPVPRLVLERASVEGRRFRVRAINALAPELEPGVLGATIDSLDRSGLVQPEDEAAGRWRFVHALVLEAAYRSLSKGVRAELHEALAAWVQEEDAERSDVEESVARHLERALQLREELGLRDERTSALSSRAGELFASAGSRAFDGLDFITSRDLLGRAAVLLPEHDPRRLALLPSLGVALTETGRSDESEVLLATAVEQSRVAGSERDALRATVQLLSNRVYRTPTEAEIDEAVKQAEATREALLTLGDEAAAGEAAVTLEYLEFTRGRIARAQDWTLEALSHTPPAGRFRASAQAAADVVGMCTLGPTSFERFPEIAEQRLFPNGDRFSVSAGHALMTIGTLMTGDEAASRAHEARWQDFIERNGLSWLGATHSLILGNVEVWIGEPERAERRLREARDVLAALGDIWWISSLETALCGALWAQDRLQEFLRLADALDATPPVSDRDFLTRRHLIRARALLVRASAADAEVVAGRGLELAETSDLVFNRAEAFLTISEVLEARGLVPEAAAARARALEPLRAKGASAVVARLEA